MSLSRCVFVLQLNLTESFAPSSTPHSSCAKKQFCNYINIFESTKENNFVKLKSGLKAKRTIHMRRSRRNIFLFLCSTFFALRARLSIRFDVVCVWKRTKIKKNPSNLLYGKTRIILFSEKKTKLSLVETASTEEVVLNWNENRKKNVTVLRFTSFLVQNISQ